MKNSQHMTGEACDIHLPNNETSREWFRWLQSNTDFDQLIMETSNGRDYWIHVRCRTNRKKNRHQIFRDMRKK